nr:hypothetical protein KitaXyl93_64510 [Kitasatospora sp. Xyl93]
MPGVVGSGVEGSGVVGSDGDDSDRDESGGDGSDDGAGGEGSTINGIPVPLGGWTLLGSRHPNGTGVPLGASRGEPS